MWASIGQHGEHFQALYLTVENSGLSGAHEVSLEVWSENVGQPQVRIEGLGLHQHCITFLGPKQTYRTFLCTILELGSKWLDERLTLVVKYKGLSGASTVRYY